MRQILRILKSVRHFIEAAFVYPFYILLRVLSPDMASDLAGWIGRTVIPLTSATRTARRNLEKTFPENTPQENERIIKNVCDNFARIMGEYQHLHKMKIYENPRFEVVGRDVIEKLKQDGQPAIIFGAHMASWEVAIMALNQAGVNTAQMYRRINNPHVDKRVMRIQQKIGYKVLHKGTRDAKKILEVLERGDHLFMLVDQKHNRGIPVPFLGREAMTAPAAVRLAMKFKCPFVPAQVERLDGYKFKITFHPPLPLVDTGNLNQDLYTNLCKMNETLETWIHQHPDQWLWLHSRWPKSEKDIRRVRLSEQF